MTTNTNTGNPTTYNGWTNYQTWRVNLGLDTDHYTERAREIAEDAIQEGTVDASEIRTAVVDHLAYEIFEEIDVLTCDMFEADHNRIGSCLLRNALNAVDYREIARHYAEGLTIWVAGWNMPGYMPDTDTAVFLSEEDARAYIVEELERATEGEDDIENMDAIAEAMDAMREGEVQTVTYAEYVYWIHSA